MSASLSLAFGLAAAASGCAGPRLVSSMATTRENRTRVIWSQNKAVPPFLFTSEQGLIDCEVAEDGQRHNCKAVQIIFQDKEQ